MSAALFNQAAPAATAPKEMSAADRLRFEAFPESGPYVLTVVAYNFIPGYENVRQDGTTEVFDALEFIFGAKTDDGYRFLKTWPTRYSIHEKSNYTKLYKAATGKLPATGSRPDDLIGTAINGDVENKDKVSRKGTKYVSSRIKGMGPVHPKLRGDIVPLAELSKVLNGIVSANNAKGNPGGAGIADDDEGPF